MHIRTKNTARRGDTLIEVVCAIVVFALVSVISLTLMNKGVSTAQASLEIIMARTEIDSQAEALRFIQSSYSAERQLPKERQNFVNIWRKITTHHDENAGDGLGNGLAIRPDELQDFSASTCQPLYDDSGPQSLRNNSSFITNTRFIIPSGMGFDYSGFDGSETYGELIKSMLVSSVDGLSRDKFVQAPLHPRIVYTLAGTGGDDSETGQLSDRGRPFRTIERIEGIWVIAVRGGRVFDGQPEYFDFHIRTCWNAPGMTIASTIGTIVRIYNPDIIIDDSLPPLPPPGKDFDAVDYVGASKSKDDSDIINQYDGIVNYGWDIPRNANPPAWTNLGSASGGSADGTFRPSSFRNTAFDNKNAVVFPSGNTNNYIMLGGNSVMPNLDKSGTIQIATTLGSAAQGVLLSNLNAGGLGIMTNVKATLTNGSFPSGFANNTSVGLNGVVQGASNPNPAGTNSYWFDRTTHSFLGTGRNSDISFSISWYQVAANNYSYEICNGSNCSKTSYRYPPRLVNSTFNFAVGASAENDGTNGNIIGSILKDAKIYSVRMYDNCALTYSNVKWNYGLDQYRFHDNPEVLGREFATHFKNGTSPPTDCYNWH